jgi:hypothetical protein
VKCLLPEGCRVSPAGATLEGREAAFDVEQGGNRKRPANIPSEEIEAVCRLVESSLQVEPHRFPKCGERVRIKSGPLAEIEGVLVRKTWGFRLVPSVEMLSKAAAVEVDVSMVERVRSVEPIGRDKQGNGPSASYPALHRPYGLVVG